MPFAREICAVAALMLPLIAGADLVISGLPEDMERNVRAYVELENEACDAEAWLLQRRFRNIEQQTRRALEPFGHYDPVVSTDLEFTDDCWRASIDVQAGEPVRLRGANVAINGEAASDPAFSAVVSPTWLAPGTQLDHRRYDGLKRSLQSLAADRGYIDATFEKSTLDVWPDTLEADIDLQLNSGPRYDFGELRQTQSFIDPRVVSGYLDIAAGSPFDSTALTRAYQDLNSSGYFSRIEITPLFDEAANGQIPIQLQLEPGNRIEYSVGAGVSTDTGPRLRGGFRNNRINVRGHKLRTDLSLSPVLQGITAEYRIPLANPRTEWTSYTAAVSSEDNDTFVSEVAGVGWRRSKQLSTSWIRTLSLDVNYERFTVGDERDDSLLVLPGISFDHKFADRDVYPNRGRRFTIELRGSSSAFGSNTSFVQVTTRLRWLKAIGKNTRLLTRATLGFSEIADFDELPPSVRYFAGGDESVRGYDYDSLGPRDVDNNVVGGSNLAVASLEVETRLRGNLYGAVFADAGNAFDDTDVDAEIGVGLGLIWRSPVGPIKLYAGYPVTDDENRDLRFHLRLGADL